MARWAGLNLLWVVFLEAGAAYGVALAGGRAGDECPAPFLCGQNDATITNTWQFDDATFANPPYGSGRIICESFPPPGEDPLTQAIGTLTWYGTYIHFQNPPLDGCIKPHLFEVKFYPNDPNYPTAPRPDVLHPTAVYTNLVPFRAFIICYLYFAPVPANKYVFAVNLEPPLAMTSGWFSVTSIQEATDCYHLIGPSDEGDGSCWRYWNSNPSAGSAVPIDIAYCLSPYNPGACCDDCNLECYDYSNEIFCAGIGGRFAAYMLCSTITPPCGQALGGCCYDDGTCELATCTDCLPRPPVGCVGDMNCDGTISFGDINPFVQYVSNFAAWQSAHPDCDPLNGDINCDGTYGQASFGDINPFVAVMVQCGQGCPCPGPISCGAPRAQGDYWAGPGTTCQPWPVGGCCTVVVPTNPPPHLEGEVNNCALDVTNGGCNYTPARFTPIQIGWTIYGQSGTFDGGYRDMDWYSFTSATPSSFTVTLEAEFDAQVIMYHQGADANDPCTGFADVSDFIYPVQPPDGTGHNLCTPIVLTTRCLPAGTYWIVVAPYNFSGVACNADYMVSLAAGGSCEVQNSCATCPGEAYVEGTVDGFAGYCADPNGADPNGGCNLPSPVFEILPHNANINPDTFTFCGKLWANGGTRDLDWWGLDLPVRSQVQWSVLSEVPCRATLLFTDNGGVYGAAGCGDPMYLWVDTLYDSCVSKNWTGTMYYDGTTVDKPYIFLVAPEGPTDAIWFGYPCPIGGADFGNDYTITMTVTGLKCENEILVKPVGNVENEANCGDPLNYVDSYNGGCDGPAPHPALTLNFDSANAWRGRTFGVADPNDPNAPLAKDYDWYQFQVTGGQRRFKVYLYADFPATWEIWDPNQPCGTDAGLIEGVNVPVCTDAGAYTRRCYPIGTYRLRVYPTGGATCGSYYYLALTEAASCNLCIFTPATNIPDDPCDDVNDYDTNAGCDDPNAPPPHFMAFTPGTFGGRIYAGLITGAPYYDPDWFTYTNTYTTARRLRLTWTSEFLAHIEVYLSCADYDAGAPIAGLDQVTGLTSSTGCPMVTVQETSSAAPGTVYYGRFTCIDQFGNLMTKYYPCAKGNNRWKVTVAGV
jgi:hypothetical protein